ncbi:MSC_0621 family F1-like ATPase epsilon subunit [Mycoplasma amphoriforme]|uniref:Uncharacterized protein n=1 Tax=Mycoplasma amphoriforme A39 TaxID=572419 RepID=A0A292II05_9MOLU|nr:unnamed protein product [Mycoplasma amphoriforme A39]
MTSKNSFNSLQIKLIKSDGNINIWNVNQMLIYNELEQLWDKVEGNVLIKNNNIFLKFISDRKKDQYLILAKSMIQKKEQMVVIYLSEPLVVYYQDKINIAAKNPRLKIQELNNRIQHLTQLQDWGLSINDQIELELVMEELKRYQFIDLFSLVAKITR